MCSVTLLILCKFLRPTNFNKKIIPPNPLHHQGLPSSQAGYFLINQFRLAVWINTKSPPSGCPSWPHAVPPKQNNTIKGHFTLTSVQEGTWSYTQFGYYCHPLKQNVLVQLTNKSMVIIRDSDALWHICLLVLPVISHNNKPPLTWRCIWVGQKSILVLSPMSVLSKREQWEKKYHEVFFF